MESKLNFKGKGHLLQCSMKGVAQELTSFVKKDQDRYGELAEQRKNAYTRVNYIKNSVDRRNYVFAFADTYRSVSAKECQKFYKKNPKEFKREKLLSLIVGSITGMVACLDRKSVV